MTEQIPHRIDNDQYDKLSRRIWELEQKLAAINQLNYDSSELAKLFDMQRLISERIEEAEENWKMMRSLTSLLGRIEEFRVKKHVDKPKP
jgi:hypothetical protein